MLRNTDLFALIKSLDLNEKRYLVNAGRKEGGERIGYVQILQALSALGNYSEDESRSIISRFSSSAKTDVKKHYLFYWILKRLHDYHSARYKTVNELNNVKVLIDKVLYPQAARIIPAIKKRLVASENYPELLFLLEMELKVSEYSDKSNPAVILEEVQEYSKQYADLKTLQLIRFRLRRMLDSNIFIRNAADKKVIDQLTSAALLQSLNRSKSFSTQYNYNLILYWKYATANDWVKAFPFALRNYQLVSKETSQIHKFPEDTIHAFFNLLNSSFVSGKNIYTRVLKEFSRIISQKLTDRIKIDLFFYINLSQLIYFNRNFQSIDNTSLIHDAAMFIKQNHNQFSRTRLNNFYFDLAKSYFYQGEYKSSFSVLNDIYQNLNVAGHTRDFYTHSRILFCIACFENQEIDLMRYSAKSSEEYMKRNQIFYLFEKRFLGFIIRDLFRFETMKSTRKLEKLRQLKIDLEQIFESPYERTVLNYFDYFFWVDLKLKQLESV
jgi:hypothetical protein